MGGGKVQKARMRFDKGRSGETAITVLSTCAHAFGRLVIIVNNAPAW
ncbi:hypothetical protein X769_13040 [Mesorhizobium sp. LSJC268A00]|nr:hypothetical protein X769_13040 [Mesorhizobium sp. LSJC268A00]